MLQFNQAGTKDAKLLQEIAQPIWQQHYTPIIGAEQVEYMLEQFQSESAIKAQINLGYEYFIIHYNTDIAGYMAVENRKSCLFISKFYLKEGFRGLGIARKMLEKVLCIARQKKISQLELTVNKNNPAYQAYLKLGFENQGVIQIDIGKGFIMDDYRMVKPVSA